MDNYEKKLLEDALKILHHLLGRAEAKEDFKPLLQFVPDNPIPFTGTKKPLAEQQEENFYPNEKKPDVGTSDEEGFVEFTEKEIKQMPNFFRKLILVNRKRCRMRRRVCGTGWTYEIRYRANGYNLSASGKTVELAKENMLKKMRNASPSERDDGQPNGVPTTFTAFALYYFENFRKAKISALTYQNDLIRCKNHIFPHFGEMPIKKITPTDCKNLLDAIIESGKGKTADEVFSLMSIVFKGAMAHALIQRNPLDVVPHVQHERQSGSALTKEEETILFATLPRDDFKTAAALALYCGLRPNELLHVRIRGDFIETINSKRKTKKTEYKRIPIIKRLRPYLPKDGVFKIPNLDSLRDQIKRALPDHKLYDLRTTFYSRCKECGVSEYALKEFAGHSLGALGNAYTDLSDDYLLSEGKKLNRW